MRISDWSSDVCSSDLDPRVQRFYVARNWLPAWSSQNVELLLGALGSAEKHGLTSAMFLPEGIQSMPPARSEERRVGKERVSKCRYRRSPSPSNKQRPHHKHTHQNKTWY